MILNLYRDSQGQDSTIGRLTIGTGASEYLFCYTCEDQRQLEKVAGETRIPHGEYEIKLRKGSPMANRYNNAHGDIGHDGMLHLQNVPDFDFVYIHIGNNHEDTEGCILVGYSATIDSVNGGGTIQRSTPAYKNLYRLVKPAIDSGETITIRIFDHGFFR